VVVGYILASVSDDVDLVWIYVESEYRHQGYATRLMNTLVKTYENKTIWLEVNKNNDVAITLYKKIGFICTHERLNYYPNKDTAIIMKKQNKAKKQN
jgi:ribosomal-protein-alanine N-acetyltransferase